MTKSERIAYRQGYQAGHAARNDKFIREVSGEVQKLCGDLFEQVRERDEVIRALLNKQYSEGQHE